MSLSYIEVNLRLTVKHLATDRGTIQERLKSVRELSKFSLTDFPEELKPKWEKIWSAATAKGSDERNEIGSVYNTLQSMSDEEAEKLAEEIWDLWGIIYYNLPKENKFK